MSKILFTLHYSYKMTLGARLRQHRENQGLTQEEVAKHLNKTKQMVSFYENDRNTPTVTILTSLASLYNISLNDFFPEGEHQIDELKFQGLTESARRRREIKREYNNTGKLTQNNPVKGKSKFAWGVKGSGIPFYDVDVFAGDVETYNDGPQNASDYLAIPGVQDCDFSCRVSGESMSRKILPGAIIACKEIKDKDLIQFGDIFLIITPENRWVKVIRRHQNSSYFLLKSYNPEYDDIDCPKEKILRLFLVKVILNQESM